MKPATLFALGCLLGWAGLADGQQPQATAISIVGMQFSPATLSVQAGTTVTWVNEDDRDHTVRADDGSFSSGNLRPGDRFSRTFSAAGNYGYHCAYHPRMKGVIAVQQAGGPRP